VTNVLKCARNSRAERQHHRTNISTCPTTKRPALDCRKLTLTERDFAVYFVGEADLADGEYHLRADRLGALEPTVRDCRADRFSISCCDVTPTTLRNLRNDIFRASSFIDATP
jgi:hypothetical protein